MLPRASFHSRSPNESASTTAPAGLRPSLAEGALIVLLLGVLGVALLPNVVVAPYEDPLREASRESLQASVADASLPPSLRVRALEELERRDGAAQAVHVALQAVRSASVARSEAGEALLGFVAERPASAAAGAVLEAWLEGRVPDATWREAFLPAGWGDAAAWTAVPLLWASEAEAHEARLMWIADVLGHAGEQPRIAVPRDAGEEEAGTLRHQTPAEALLSYVQRYLADTPPRHMRPTLELRLYENLRRTPRYLAPEVARLAEQVVASERLPLQDAQLGDVAPETYANEVFALAEAVMPPERFATWLEELARGTGNGTAAQAYADYAAARLR